MLNLNKQEFKEFYACNHLLKILHIDDNESITTVFSKILTLRNHEYIPINESRKGLQVLLDEEFDAVFLDLSMPGFSGFEVLEELQKQGKSRDNITVMTAATLAEKEKSKLKEYGIKSILFKPIKLTKLLEQIEQFKPKEKSITVK